MRFLKKKSYLFAATLLVNSAIVTGITSDAITHAQEISNCKPIMCGLPNPVVEYKSVEAAENDVKISALKVDNTAFKLNRISVIDKKIIELEYVSINYDELMITTRTASNKDITSITGDENNKNISGIYGAEWYDENIGDVYIHEANLDNNTSVGYWNKDEYSYSVQITNTTPKQFWNLVVPIYRTVFPEV